jgi:hypothetical protein
MGNRDIYREYRKASSSGCFPYASERVPFIMVKNGQVRWAQGRWAKLELLSERGGKLLAAWPGEWRTDVFEIDDREAAKAALEH